MITIAARLYTSTLSRILLLSGCVLALNTQAQEPTPDRMIRTAYYPVQVNYHDGLIPRSDTQAGGAIDKLGDHYIGVTGAGAFYRIIPGSGDTGMTAEKMDLPTPHNPAEFDADAQPLVIRAFFRVIDIVSRPTASGWQLFASHHHWLPDSKCLVMRVSMLELDKNLARVNNNKPWQVIYQTTPCLTLKEGNRGRILAGHESGGRMGWLASGKLLFTVGDLEHDGWYQPGDLSQRDDASYGKVIEIDADKREGIIYSKGHRNPQGLYIDSAGTIWESEHGPRGGDEINIVVRGKNYGWPRVTYGTDYGRYNWPPATSPTGDHGDYEQPVFAFVPSIGTSNLIRLEGSQFEHWNGNLLLAGLASRTLYRISLHDNRVVYSEPLAVERRIRDIAIGPDHQIWLWGETGELIELSVADVQGKGAQLFQICAGCHTTGVSSGGLGPSLIGIVGREMASRTDYNYSDAFQQLDGEWNEELLDRFLQDPNAFVPGTTMNELKLDDAEDRKAIIEYLRDSVYTY